MSESFLIGRLVATKGVNDLSNANHEFSNFMAKCFSRYEACDWGDLCDSDRKQNDRAVKTGNERIMAAYKHPTHEEWRLWIITEWDRSVTTILFPSEY